MRNATDFSDDLHFLDSYILGRKIQSNVQIDWEPVGQNQFDSLFASIPEGILKLNSCCPLTINCFVINISFLQWMNYII